MAIPMNYTDLYSNSVLLAWCSYTRKFMKVTIMNNRTLQHALIYQSWGRTRRGTIHYSKSRDARKLCYMFTFAIAGIALLHYTCAFNASA